MEQKIQFKPFAYSVAKNRYLRKNGGIYEIVNDLDKKQKYEKFLSKLLNACLIDKSDKTFKWKQKRKMRK
jgi:hypothetical protein